MGPRSGSRRTGAQPLRGVSAWRWYARFLRDPIRALERAPDELGALAAFAYPLPVRGREIWHVSALGPEWNRRVFTDTETFRPTGEGIGGPRGSAQWRLRKGLTRSTGKRHDWQRQLVIPQLQRTAVEPTVPAMAAVARDALAGWRAGARVDLWPAMRRLSLRLADRLLCTRPDPFRADALGAAIDEWLRRGVSPLAWMLPIDLPGTPYRALLRHAERLELAIATLVEEEREVGGDGPLARLARANEAGHAWMGDAELVGQVAVLFAASYETTASALSWLLYLLAQHPDVARDLRDEIDGRLRGGEPSARSLAGMPLLDGVVKESLRLFPPVPYTVRVATAETELGHFRLARRDRVVCSHYVTHRQPDLYPDARRFRPGRWSAARPGPYDYLPFGAGPRSCVGIPFALLSLKVSVVEMLRRFDFRVAPGAAVGRRVRVVMSPAPGLPVTLHPPGAGFRAVPVRGAVQGMLELPQAP